MVFCQLTEKECGYLDHFKKSLCVLLVTCMGNAKLIREPFHIIIHKRVKYDGSTLGLVQSDT